MARKKKTTIITSNREIYEKLSMLNFLPEVVLRNIKPIQISKILHNINKDMKVLDTEYIGNYLLVIKLNPINFHIYMRDKKK